MCRKNFTVGNMELRLVKEEEGSEEHRCSILDELRWDIHIDTLQGHVYIDERLGTILEY